MSDIVDELRSLQTPEECRSLMLWAAAVIETGRKRFIEKVERIDKLEAENEKLRESLPLIDNRTRNQARELIGSAERFYDVLGGSQMLVQLDRCQDVVERLLSENTNLRELVARLQKFIGIVDTELRITDTKGVEP